MRLKDNMMTPRRIANIKRLLVRNTIRQVASLSKESYTTIYRVSIGWYDTGKLEKPKREKPNPFTFDVDAEQDWIVGGIVNKKSKAA